MLEYSIKNGKIASSVGMALVLFYKHRSQLHDHAFAQETIDSREEQKYKTSYLLYIVTFLR